MVRRWTTRALLYDQAFALLGLASARRLLGPDPAIEEAAPTLLDVLNSQLKRVGEGFYSGLPMRFPLLSNPHMHLLEAALAWCELSTDPTWRTLADEIGTWRWPVSSIRRTVYCARASMRHGPRHLVRRAGESSPVTSSNGHGCCCVGAPKRTAAPGARPRKLIEIGEQYGVRQGFAIDALLDDLSVHEASSRLWPQTERLKASALAAALTGEHRGTGTAPPPPRRACCATSIPRPPDYGMTAEVQKALSWPSRPRPAASTISLAPSRG